MAVPLPHRTYPVDIELFKGVPNFPVFVLKKRGLPSASKRGKADPGILLAPSFMISSFTGEEALDPN
jgi:hypothetical protein